MNSTGEPASPDDCQQWYLCSCLLAVILLAYATFELHYFIRFIFCWIIARLFKKRLHVLDQATVQGICVLNDVDVLLTHMNNARYARELDFARVDFYERTGLYAAVRRRGGGIVQGACTIRYRKPLPTFSRYLITTKIIWWDEVSLYMEHRFLRRSDNFVLCVTLCRQRATAGVNIREVMRAQLGRPEVESGSACEFPGPPPPDLALWIESNALSSAALRGTVGTEQSNGTKIEDQVSNTKGDLPHLTTVMPAPTIQVE